MNLRHSVCILPSSMSHFKFRRLTLFLLLMRKIINVCQIRIAFRTCCEALKSHWTQCKATVILYFKFFILMCQSTCHWCRGKWCIYDTNGWCWCWHQWPGRSTGSYGIWLCNGAVSIFEALASGAWSLELPAPGIHGSLQFLSQCSFCYDAFLVSLPIGICECLKI